MRKLDYLKIKLRPLLNTDEDIKLFARWYQKPEIYSHFINKRLNIWDIEKRIEPYTDINSSKRIFIYGYDNTDLGAIKYYIFNQNAHGFLGFDNTLVYQIEFFLGEEEYQNKGITSMAIELIAHHIMKYNGADMIVASISITNKKAYKCLKKAGFKKRGLFIKENSMGINEKHYFLYLMKSFRSIDKR